MTPPAGDALAAAAPSAGVPLPAAPALADAVHPLPQWSDDASPAWAEARALWEERCDRLEGMDDARTEEEWVRPVLSRVLGWVWEAAPPSEDDASDVRHPGYALFVDPAARADGRIAAVADAARWNLPLDVADPVSHHNPTFRLIAASETAGSEWAILTNGREWRLHSAHWRSRAEAWFTADLARMLEEGDEEAFRLFHLFFRAESYRGDPRTGGTAFVDAAMAAAAERGAELERRLREAIFGDVFERLARGFVDGRRRRGIVDSTDAALHEVYEGTLRLLYRLLFLLHAEARDLLPARDERGYGARSLARLRQTVAARRDAGQPLSPLSTAVWDELVALFDLVARGNSAMGVPRCDGAVFRPDDARDDFLRENAVSDFFLVHALDHLSRDADRRFLDYRALPVEQLGALYEGLLDHRLTVDEGGKPVLLGDGDRRATGSYYTPRWIVDYLAAETVGPALAERETRFRESMGEVAGLRARHAAAEGDDRARLEREIHAVREWAADDLLSLRVCDPAMGSGHFLVHAADWITARIAALLDELPGNPVTARLAAQRREIVAALSAHSARVDPARIGDAALLKRTVVRRCLFGVDLSPMAAELARVSLWLDAFVPGAPLPLLDHHLKCGNALVGTRVDEVQRAIEEDPRGQLDAFGGPFRELLRTFAGLRDVAREDDATAEAAEATARRFADFERAVSPYRRLLDVWVSRAFGNRLGGELASLHGTEVLDAARGVHTAFGPAHREAIARSENLAAEHRFFHWDLEFPEVYADLERGVWRNAPGFDVVIGNPPYVRHEQVAGLKPFLAAAHADVHDGAADLYVYFVHQGLALLRPGGRVAFVLANKWLRAGYGEALRRFLAERGETERIVDFGHAAVFPDADVFPCLLVVRRPDGTADREGDARVALVPHEALGKDLRRFVASHAYAVPRARFGRGPWSLEPNAVEALLEKIRSAGVPLQEAAGAAPLYGVKTGLNEAFLVDSQTRERIVAADPRAAEVLRPYLRGQDVERWSPAWAGTWMIVLKSSETAVWPWTGMTEPAAEEVFRKSYPSVHAHLKEFETRLRVRQDQGRYWWELRTCAYYELFEEPKLVIQRIAFHPRVSLDTGRMYLNDSAIVLPSDDRWTLAVLNSPVLWYFAFRSLPHKKDEALAMDIDKVQALPVALPTAEFRAEAEVSVDRLIQLTEERRALEAELLTWLQTEYGVAQPGPRLEASADLAATEFVEEVRRRRPRKADPLTPRQVGMLRNAHADYAPRITAVAAKIAGLERKLSQLVSRAYGLTAEEVELMWSTAPPRMPVGR